MRMRPSRSNIIRAKVAFDRARVKYAGLIEAYARKEDGKPHHHRCPLDPIGADVASVGEAEPCWCGITLEEIRDTEIRMLLADSKQRKESSA